MGRWPKRDAAARGSSWASSARSLVVGGEERPVAGEKLQALLARLLLDANRAVSDRALIDELWGDEPPATARQSLHVHVGRLRRLLADADGPSPLETTGGGYLLRLGADELDALRFRSLVESARAEQAAGRLGAAADAYREALALWRGDALEGIALPWAEAERARLDELRLGAIEELVDIDLQLGRAAELVPELERLVAEGAAARAPARTAHARVVRSRSSGRRPRRLSGGAPRARRGRPRSPGRACASSSRRSCARIRR